MAAPKLLGLVALFSVALSLVHVDALVADRAHVARHVHARNAVAHRKRDSATCQPKPTSSLDTSVPTTTSPPPTTSTVPPPSSTTPPPSSTASATSSPTSGRRPWCLAYAADPQYMNNFVFSNVGYYYDWDAQPPNGLNAFGMTGMPMLHDANSDTLTAFNNDVVNGPDNSGGIALFLNEPDIPSQANVDPYTAVGLWWKYMEPLKSKGYNLVSAAVVNDASGAQWLQEFMAACNGCHVDYMAYHAYTTNAQDLVGFGQQLYQTYNRPVLVTEFADQDYSGLNQQADWSGVWSYAATVRDFVNNNDWVLAACPFGLMTPPLPVNVNNDNLLYDDTTHGPTALASFYFGS